MGGICNILHIPFYIDGRKFHLGPGPHSKCYQYDSENGRDETPGLSPETPVDSNPKRTGGTSCNTVTAKGTID